MPEPRIVAPEEAQRQIERFGTWVQGARDLAYTVATEPDRERAAVLERDGEWSQGIADAIGEYPANPSVARDRIAAIMADQTRAAQAAAWDAGASAWAHSMWDGDRAGVVQNPYRAEAIENGARL